MADEIRVNDGYIEVNRVRVAKLLPEADEKEMRELFSRREFLYSEDDDDYQ